MQSKQVNRIEILRCILPFLCLLLTTSLCSSMIIPFMGFFIVEGLGREPWSISLYAGLAMLLTVFANRMFSKRLDRGETAFPLIGIAAIGYVVANLSLVVVPSFVTLITVAVIGFGLSSSATSTLYSLGHGVAKTAGLRPETFNSFMRATTSTAWMMGPALSFSVAGRFSPETVFQVAFCLGVIWLVLWYQVVSRDARIRSKSEAQNDLTPPPRELLLAATVCFCISLGHSLTFTALPLFYVKELNLPTYAPGLAFTMKTLVEIFAILSTPWLIVKFGLRPMLMGIALISAATIQYLHTVTSLAEMLIGAAFEGFYYGLYASVGLSFVQSFAGGQLARATAIYWNTLILSGLIAGPLAGLVAHFESFALTIQLASIGGIISFLLLCFVKGAR